MRKDVLLSKWSEKVRYADSYEIKVGAMLSEDYEGIVLELFADLYIDGEIDTMESLDRIENADDIVKIPSKMKRKAKSFVEYFKSSYVFGDVISFNENIIVV